MRTNQNNGAVGKTKVLPDTQKRVSEHTAESVNQRIRQQTEKTVSALSGSGEDEITRHLNDLDREWDIERVLETNASALIVTGLLLGSTVNRRFLLIPAVVGSFLLQHALQGWCPPMPLFRRMGYRTAREIDEERQALKVARGDFNALKLKHRGAASTTQKIMNAVER